MSKTMRRFAVDPTTKGFAWALLEGRDTLVGWGTIQVGVPKNESSLARITGLLEQFRPDVVVLEDLDGARNRASRIAALLAEVAKAAGRKRIRTCRIDRQRVVEVLGPEVRTKYDAARSLAERFPELRARLPRPRKPWMSEDARMNIFDAVGLAVAASQTKLPCD